MKKSYNILVVDDEPEIIGVVTDFFNIRGNFTTFEARNGQDAIEVVKSNDLDIVMLDLVMPKMDGVETLKAIKEIKPSLGVVIMSGLRDEDLARETIKLGAYDYVVKPFNYKQLDLIIMTHLIMREDAA